jgi:hypothetical protein
VTKVTEALSLIIHVDPRPTGLMTGYDGGDGVEAKPATKRDDHPRTAMLLFVVTDTAQPRHFRHEREKNIAGRPVGRGSEAVTELVTGWCLGPLTSSPSVTYPLRGAFLVRPTACRAGRQAPPNARWRASEAPGHLVVTLWLQQGSRNNFRIIASPELACFGGYHLKEASNVCLRQHHEARAAA